MKRLRPAAAALLLCALAASACKPPRSPREQVGESLTGAWAAESAPPGAGADTGRVAWALRLEQRPAGKLEGEGRLGGATAFRVSGVRGESEVTLYFDLPGERVKYHGGIMDPKSIVGELYLPGDTLPVTFTRE